MDDTIHSEERHGCTITIVPDADPPDPRDADNLGTMVCWHRRYDLGDERPRGDAQEWLERFLGLGDDEAERLYKAAAAAVAERHRPENLRRANAAYFDALWARFTERAVALPLFLYDHSGLTMNTTGFSCPWDSGQIGWIYVPVAALEAAGLTREDAAALLRAEVAVYDAYLRGAYVGFVVRRGADELDSCWGFDDVTYALGEARAACDRFAAVPEATE